MEIVGLLAASLLMAASAPQLLAVLRGDGHGVSLLTWILFLASGTVWLVFGIKLESLALVVGNVAGVLAYLLLGLYAANGVWRVLIGSAGRGAQVIPECRSSRSR